MKDHVDGYQANDELKSEGGSEGREEIIRQLMDCCPVPMLLIEKEERVLYLNRSFIMSLGYSLQDLPDVDAWWPLAYPDEDYRREMLARWMGAGQRMDGVRSLPEPGRLAKVRCKDGTFKQMEIHGANLGRDSIIIYVDVTARVEAEKRQAQLIDELAAALKDIKQLSGLLPICSSCKKIRDSKQYWRQVEEYIEVHSGVQFTHSICPDCARELYPEIFDGSE